MAFSGLQAGLDSCVTPSGEAGMGVSLENISYIYAIFPVSRGGGGGSRCPA